jgi:hypothetical protein
VDYHDSRHVTTYIKMAIPALQRGCRLRPDVYVALAELLAGERETGPSVDSRIRLRLAVTGGLVYHPRAWIEQLQPAVQGI